ncbi:MAG: hypothetical protein V3R25_05990 [Nitrosomonadaceae bacterium]
MSESKANYVDRFTGWYQGVDMSFDMIPDPFSVLEDTLYPYKLGGDVHPLDHRAMIERICIVDAALLKCTKN